VGQGLPVRERGFPTEKWDFQLGRGVSLLRSWVSNSGREVSLLESASPCEENLSPRRSGCQKTREGRRPGQDNVPSVLARGGVFVREAAPSAPGEVLPFEMTLRDDGPSYVLDPGLPMDFNTYTYQPGAHELAAVSVECFSFL
jgi:hypothetical protein